MAIIRGRKRRGGVGGRFILCPQFTGTTEGGGERGLPLLLFQPRFLSQVFFLGRETKVCPPPPKKNENGFSTLVINLLFSPQTEIHFSGSSDPNLGRSNIGRRRRKRYSRGIKRERENISSSDCPEKKDRNFLSQASWFPSSLFLKVFYFL